MGLLLGSGVWAGTAGAHAGPDDVPLVDTGVEAPVDDLGHTEKHAALASKARFEPNLGQSDTEVAFQARTPGYTFFLTKTEAVFVLGGEGDGEPKGRDRVVRMQFVDASEDPTIKGQGKRSGVSNYLYGNDPDQWTTNVPQYDEVLMEDLWPGIDMVFLTTEEGAIRFDFHVHPGADPDSIRLAFEGAEPRLDEAGGLVLESAETPILGFPAPFTFQEKDGAVVEVPSGYTLDDQGGLGFKTDAYDPSLLLVIDPAVLQYASYHGGTGTDFAFDVALDPDGHVYVTGRTASSDFPVQDGYQTTHPGTNAAFVTKFAPGGDTIVYSTFVGGSGFDEARAIAVDNAGQAFVHGRTNSGNFPTLNAFMGSNPGSTSGVVFKLGDQGDDLVYSTYLGGDAVEFSADLALDASGHAYVTGFTESMDFPTENALQPDHPDPSCTDRHCETAYVAKLGQGGDSLVYSTYLGGDSIDNGHSIAVDGSGNAYITGETRSTDFPTHNAFIGTKPSLGTAFVTKLAPSGDSLVFSTYLGGSSGARGKGITIDGDGHAYVTGHTFGDFPIKNAFQDTFPGMRSGFITKFTQPGDDIVYSTYLGGSENFDNSEDIAVDASGHAYVVGQTPSEDFPVKNAFQDTHPGETTGFVAQLAPSGDDLVFSTFIGGSGVDRTWGITIDAAGVAYVAGQTDSTDFLVTSDALQETQPGSTSGFLSILSSPPCDTPGPDAYGYTCSDSDPSYEDISATGTALTLGNDEVSAPIDLTDGGNLDSFLYYGKSYTEVRVSSNGFLTFSDSTEAGCCSGLAFPDGADPNAVVAGYWSDLDPSSGGEIHWTFEAEPDRFIVQFKDVPSSFGPQRATFQIVLNHETHEVHVPFGPVAGHNDLIASTGIEDHDGLVGLTYKNEAFNSPGNEIMDTGDGVYLNLDTADGDPERVEENDVRIADFDGNSAGRQVTLSDSDIAYGLVLDLQTTLCYVDVDDDGTPDSGEPLYLKNNALACGNTQPGDFRLSAAGSHNPGTFVAAGDSDEGDVLSEGEPFNSRLMFADTDSSGSYNAGDYVYVKTGGDSGTDIEPGDYRLTPTQSNSPFTWVQLGDDDQETFLLDEFPADPHIDTANVLAYYDSQKRTVDFTPPEPTVPVAIVIVNHTVAFDNTVTINWQPPADNGMSHLVSYEVYRGDTPDTLAHYESVGADQLSYDDTGVQPGETLYYAVAAKNGEGEGPLSDSEEVQAFDLPGAPQNLVATAGPGVGEISLDWEEPLSDGGSPITDYHIHVSSTTGGPYDLLDTVDDTTFSYTHTGLGNGATQYYVVTAESEVGESENSNEDSATTFEGPDPPENLVATAGPGIGEITLNWDEPLDNGGSPITDYHILGSDSQGGPFTLVDSVGPETLTYTETGLSSGATRYYVVTAESEAGESEASNEDSATTLDVPGAPENLVASAGPGVGEITLDWDEPLDNGGSPITDYHIYGTDTEDGLFSLVDSVGPETLTYTETGLGNGETRYYRVTAENEVGESENSNIDSATTFELPGAPQNLEVITGAAQGEIDLDWEPPLDDGGLPVTQYHVYRGADLEGLDKIDSTTSTEYLDSGLGDGETWFYAVSAENDAGEGETTDSLGSTTQIPGEPAPLPEGRSATSAAFQGHYAYVFGGRHEVGNTTDTIFRFNPNTGETTTLNLTLPSPRLGTSAIWADIDTNGAGAQGCHPNCLIGTGYIFGGTKDDTLAVEGVGADNLEGNQVVEFDPANHEVTVLNATFPEARFGTSAVWDPTDEVSYIFGGFPSNDGGGGAGAQGCHPNCMVGEQIMEFDPKADTMVQHDATLPAPLGGTSSVWDDNEKVAYIFGGFHDDGGGGAGINGCHPNCMVGIYEFDPKFEVSGQHSGVEPLPVQLPGERWNTSAVFDGRYAYIIGGENETGPIDQIVRFDPVEMEVEIVGSLPTNRTQSSAIFDGTDAYIFGGLEADNTSTDEIVRFRPTAPQQAEAKGGPAAGETTLTWGPPADDGGEAILEYRVYRADQEDGPLGLIAAIPSSTTEFVDTGLGDGTTVHYRVSAVNAIGEGPQSHLVSATTFDVPGAPENAEATPGPEFGDLTISWDAPGDDGGTAITQYKVARSDDPGGPFATIGTVPGGNRSFTDPGLGELETRYYTVHAENLIGDGPPTPAIEGKTYDPMNIYVREGELTIQQAMDFIAPGGTIHIAPGTYPEEGFLSTNATIQEGTADGPAPDGAQHPRPALILGGIHVADAPDVTIRDLEIHATRGGTLPGIALLTESVGRVHMENVTFQGDGSPRGEGIHPGLVDIRDVHNVTFVDNQLTGDPSASGGTSGLRVAYRPDGNVSLRVNQSTLQDVNGVGLAVRGQNPSATIELLENNITGNTDGMLLLDTVFGNLTGVDNQILDNDEKGVQYAGQVQGESLLRHNHFVGNDVGLAVSTQSDRVDARYNWWGSPGGPPLGDQANMLLVDYTPWCVQADCSATEVLEPIVPRL